MANLIKSGAFRPSSVLSHFCVKNRRFILSTLGTLLFEEILETNGEIEEKPRRVSFLKNVGTH